MKNLLVVVDMLNGFLNKGNLADKKMNKIVPNVVSLIENAKMFNFSIIAFKDVHNENDEEFKTYPPHCIKGTKECDLIPELKKFEKDMTIIEKNTTNGFNTAKFKSMIYKNFYDNIVVCGCCTDICVYNFVKSLNEYIKKFNIKTNIMVAKNAVDTFDMENHSATDVNNRYLFIMEKMGIKMLDFNDKNKGLNF